MSQRFFECGKHAEIYAKARPRFSEEVFDLIFQYCQTRGGKFKLAVDVACGTGHQSTLPLLDRFEQVIGVDVSEEQLKQAPKNVANLDFKQSTAEKLCCDPNSVDLVTAACGLHWFNIPEFFSEVERVLSPGGCLAVYCYGWPSLPETADQEIFEEQSSAQDILQRFIKSKLCDFHNEGTRMCTDGYTDVELPFQETQRHSVDLKMDWTVDQLWDFIQSTALWRNRLKNIPNCDSLNVLAKDLREFYRGSSIDENPRITVVFRVTILLGRKPLGEIK